MAEAPARQSADLVAAARDLAGLVDKHADESEAERRLAGPLVRAFTEAGLFRLLVPRELDGPEADPVTMVEVIEEVSRADGAAGWCVMIAATSSLQAAYLPEPWASRIYGDPAVCTGGVFAPNGRAEACDGGWTVSGRWPFASGSQHCQWLMGGTLLDGTPHLAFAPADRVEIVDTWDTMGLRGTGSHDIVYDAVDVPAGLMVSLVGDKPRRGGSLYHVPVMGLLAVGVSSVALGIGRRALDELVALAGSRRPGGGRRTLAERGVAQAEIARAEATLRAGRALLLETVRTAWAEARAGERVGTERRAELRLAATNATRSAAAAVDVAYDLGGGGAVYRSSPLERCRRDVHTATQHVMIAPPTYELAGRVLLGQALAPGTLL